MQPDIVHKRLFKKWQMQGAKQILSRNAHEVRETQNLFCNAAYATFSTVSSHQKFIVTIIGNYGATNLGDEAILAGILKELRSELKRKLLIYANTELILQVLSYNPLNTAHLHPTLRCYYLLPFGIRSFLNGFFKGEFLKTCTALRKSDLVILGGGGLFTDEKIMAVFLWAYHFIFAKLLSKYIWMYAQSIGPLRYRLTRYIVKVCFNQADFISTRDSSSKTLLRRLGIRKKIEVRADPAFNLKSDHRLISAKKSFQLWLNQHKLKKYRYIAVSLRKWPSFTLDKQKEVVCCLDYLIQKLDLNIVLLPFQKISSDDYGLLREIKSFSHHSEHIFLEPYTDNFCNIMQIIAHSKFLVGMRLHSLIFAEIVKTPYIGLCYSDKIWAFLAEVNRKGQGIGIQNISFESLLEAVRKQNFVKCHDNSKFKNQNSKINIFH